MKPLLHPNIPAVKFEEAGCYGDGLPVAGCYGDGLPVAGCYTDGEGVTSPAAHRRLSTAVKIKRKLSR